MKIDCDKTETLQTTVIIRNSIQ